MKTNRRRFLSLLGVGTAAGPLAAKAALDESIARQVGISTISVSGGGWVAGSGPTADSVGQIVPYEERVAKSMQWIRLFGFPDFFEKEMRESSKYVHTLDADIACKRSWSMAARIQEQRARNFERQKQSYENQANKLTKKSLLEKALGFEWPWN